MNTKMLREDGSVDQLVLPDLDSPSLYTKEDAIRRAQWILSHFDDTHKTESAFYLTFNRLDRNDIAFLMAYWKLEDDWSVFKRLSSMYKIKVA
jgi:hypothetical protein